MYYNRNEYREVYAYSKNFEGRCAPYMPTFKFYPKKGIIEKYESPTLQHPNLTTFKPIFQYISIPMV